MTPTDSTTDPVRPVTAQTTPPVDGGKVAARPTVELQAGRVYEAVVTTKVKPSEGGPVPEKGVVISGKFIPVEVSPEYSEGDAVKVLVQKVTQDEVSAKIIARASKGDRGSNDIKQEILREFQNLLNLPDKELAQLKQALETSLQASSSAIKFNISDQGEGIQKLLQSVFGSLAEKGTVVSEEMVKDLSRLQKSLEQSLAQEVKVKTSHEHVQKGSQTNLTGYKVSSIVSELQEGIEKVLNSLTGNTQKSERSQVEAEKPSAGKSEKNVSDSKVNQNDQASVKALVDTIKSFSDRLSDQLRISDNRVVRFVKAQLDTLKGSEAEMGQALVRTVEKGDVALLIDTLKQVELKAGVTKTVDDRTLLKLARELRVGLETNLEKFSVVGEESLRQVLDDASARLSQMIKSEPGAEKVSTASPKDVPEGLSREFMTLHKSLKAQVETLLKLQELSPEDGLQEKVQAEESLKKLVSVLKDIADKVTGSVRNVEEKVVQTVKDQLNFLSGKEVSMQETIRATSVKSGVSLLLDTLRQVENRAGEQLIEVDQRFVKFIKTFEADLEAVHRSREGGIETAVRRVLKRALIELDKQAGGETALDVKSLDAGVEVPAGLSKELSNFFKSVDAQIRTILSLPDAPILQEYVSEGAMAPALREFAGQVDRLIEILRKLDLSQFSERSGEESKFYKFAAELLENLDSLKSTKASFVEIRDLLQNASGELRNIFSPDIEKPSDFSVGNLPVKSQEIAKEITEVLKELLQLSVDLEGGEAALAAKDLSAAVMKFLPLWKDSQAVLEGKTPQDISAELTGPGVKQQVSNILEALSFLSKQVSAGEQDNAVVAVLRDFIGALPEKGIAGREALEQLQTVYDKLQKVIHPEIGQEKYLNDTAQDLTQAPIKEASKLVLSELKKLLSSFEATEPENHEKILEYLSTNVLIPPAGNVLEGAAEKTEGLMLKLLKLVGTFKDSLESLDLSKESPLAKLLESLPAQLNPKEGLGAGKADYLRKALETLRQFSEEKMGGKSNDIVKNNMQALRTFENILRGQEIFRQLNPVLQTAGEPIMLLFPALIQGYLSTLEVTYTPSYEYDEFEKKKNSGSGEGSYNRIHLNISLPGPGPVQVDMAFRQDELLVNMIVRDDEVKSFMEEYVSLLRRAISKHGFNKLEVNIQAGEPEKIRPRWVDELARSGGIVA